MEAFSQIGRDRPAMAAVGGLFEAAFLTCLKIVIAHQPGDPVASGDDTVFHEIGVHARAPISLPRHAKALADMGKKHHVFALAFARGAALPSEITALADFENFTKARDREFGFLRVDE